MQLKAPERLRFEGYEVDTRRWTLMWQQEPIPLPRKTFDLLLYLIEHRDHVSSKDDLLKDLWPKQVVEESNLTQQIFLLRKALTRHQPDRPIIETVPGRGYRFVAPVESSPLREDQELTVRSIVDHRITQLTIEEEIEDLPNTDQGRTLSKPWVRVLTLVAVAIVLSAAGIGLWRYVDNPKTAAALNVVLAEFTNETGDPALSTALNDAVRIDLGQSPLLTVITPRKVKTTLGQMGKASDATLTSALAREVCERVSGQVLVEGNVARFGQKYVVSLHASRCLTESTTSMSSVAKESLAEAKLEVDALDQLPAAVDELAAILRRKLGESHASIQRLDKPLLSADTGSLDALKAYSQGHRLAEEGKRQEALPLLQRAVELDPGFAIAYLDLSTTYFALLDSVHAREALGKAYALRDKAPESATLYITVLFNEVVTGDLAKSLEASETLAALYPNKSYALSAVARAYGNIGKPELGLDAAKRALELDPGSYALYQNLASSQLHSGHVDDARRTCELAVTKHKDSAGIHDLLLQAMYVQHDDAGVAAQLQWAHTNGDPLVFSYDEIAMALSQGRLHKAQQLSDELSRHEAAPADRAAYELIARVLSMLLAEEGARDASLALLKAIDTASPDSHIFVALAEDGKVAEAEAGLAREAATHHDVDTLWRKEEAPEAQAAIFLAEHKPQAAVTALEPARDFDAMDFLPAYLRGKAYYQLGKPDLAIAEFKKISERQYIDPLLNEYPLAILELARTYSSAGDVAKARDAYSELFRIWAGADADFPPLLAARTEFASLGAKSVPN